MMEIRGKNISHFSHKKKTKENKEEKLINEIMNLEKQKWLCFDY